MGILLGHHFKSPSPPSALDTTVTVGTLPNVYSTWTTHATWWYDAWGYAEVEDYYSYGSTVGSMDDTTYDDGGATERTVVGVHTTDVSNYFIFSLEGTSIPNTDTTFVNVVANGVTYARADATYVASKNGGTHWYWYDPSGPWGAPPGAYSFKVNI